MSTRVITDGRLVEEWDDATRLHTRYDGAGAVVEQVGYTPEENAAADARAADTTRGVNAATLRDRAAQALTVNTAFLAIPTPTNAQVVAQVQALTRQSSAVIRLITGALESTT